MEKVNLEDKLSQFQEMWSPKIIGALNGQLVKLVKVKGAFVWHRHENEDELFLILDGTLDIEFRDRTIHLKQGEFLVVPRGIEHRPVAKEEASILLFEPEATLNTGDTSGPMTVENLEWI
jgi:mannose-6-phosphate isomerase-like protein (cupin superfamily)